MNTSGNPGEQSPMLKVFCSLGVRGVLVEAVSILETRGLAISVLYESTKAIEQRLDKGEHADVAILVDTSIDRLIQSGVLMVGSRRDLASSGVAIAVQAGATRPDISTVEAFKRALLDTPSVAYSLTGASGLHFSSVIDRLGIAEEIKRKATVRDGLMGELAACGEVAIAVQQMSELKPVRGIEIVGPIPVAVQKTTVFSAGISADTMHPDLARELLAFFDTQEGQALIKDKGLDLVA